VTLAEIVVNPHFYGVGAMEALQGEITILDSEAIVTAVAGDGLPQPMESAAAKAALLVGQSIERWMDLAVAEEVSPGQLDETIEVMAARRGIDVSKPFVFVIEGEFREVRLHIINGACPVHARKRKLDIAEENRPFELDMDRVNGTLVGVYAADSAGKLTHPGTSIHAHLIYIDKKTSKRITGHIEQAGLTKGAILRLPASGEQGAAPARPSPEEAG